MRIRTMKIRTGGAAMILLAAAVVFTFPDQRTREGNRENTPDEPLSSLSGIYEPPCCDGSGYDPPGKVLPEVSLDRPTAGNSVLDTTFGTTITALPIGGTCC
jgi:hypothetical protein